MLVMISDIKGHDIDRTVIAECFLRNIESEMLLDPTRAQRMQPDGKEKRKREIEKTGSAEKINDGHVIGEGAGQIEKQPATPHGVGLHPRRPRQLHKRKQHEPDRLAIPD